MRVVNLTQDDIFIDTQKVTAGYFPGGLGTTLGTSLTTGSLSATQLKYYTNLQHTSEDVFSVTYGNIDGSGSSAASLNAGVGETQAVYNSYASYLLRANDIIDGFKINSTSTTDKDVYILLAERARMKDSINPGNWTLGLSGSTTAGAAASLQLTDDSKTTAATISPVGPRYNVYEGTAGTVTSTTVKYGHFFPTVGAIVLSGNSLSSSIPGTTGHNIAASASAFLPTQSGLKNGFTSLTSNDANNYYKLATAMAKFSGNQQFRNEEEQTTVTYFCRALSRDFNHSSSPTFTSGSEGKYRQSSFEGNPQTVITTVGLMSNEKKCVAVGRLSKGILKNYSTEATIKVKLTY